MIKWKRIVSNIPAHVQVGRNSVYEVSWIDAFKDPSVLGETRFDPNRIIIKNNESDKETAFTFYHEFLHALSDEYGVNLTETQVKALEKSFYYMLKCMNELTKGSKNAKTKRRSKK